MFFGLNIFCLALCTCNVFGLGVFGFFLPLLLFWGGIFCLFVCFLHYEFMSFSFTLVEGISALLLPWEISSFRINYAGTSN